MSVEKIECLSWAKEEWETPEKTIAGLKSLIEAVQDFPIKGVLFRDIMPIFRVPLAVSSMIDMIAAYIEVHYADVDAIVGLDARGFLFGPMIALSLEKPFLPIRKKGKLPGKCISIESSKEYGSDILEMQCSGISEGYNVIIVDDLLATGGTMISSCALVRKSGGNVLACLVLVELLDLKGREKLDCPVCSFITFE
nr:adenine phosphoribosyltransferase [Hydra vulgaris]